MFQFRSRGRAALLAAALAAALPAAGLAPDAAAASAARPGHFSAADRADIQRAQDYLNAITSLKARFLQIADNGSQAEGTAYLDRPGRLRLQYDPPSPLLVVADGTFLIVQDKTLDNPSYIPLSQTPAGVLVQANVRLDGGDLRVTRVIHQPGVIGIGVEQADDPGEGELTLVFSDRPFELRQWRVRDAQGLTTTVSLYDVDTGMKLDPDLFVFKMPGFGRPKF